MGEAEEDQRRGGPSARAVDDLAGLAVRWNGPPIAAGAATFRNPPSAHSISNSPTSRLPANAPTTTSGRVVRSIMKFPFAGSEAGGDAGGDHLEHLCCSVMEPEHQSAQQNGNAEARAPDHHRRRDPARRLQGARQLLRIGKRVSHSRDHLNEATGAAVFGHPRQSVPDR